MKFDLTKNLLLLSFALVLLAGCSNVIYQINDWRFSGTGYVKHDSPGSPLCIVKPQVFSNYYWDYKGQVIDHLDLNCKLNISFDKTVIDSSQVDSIVIKSVDYNRSYNFGDRYLGKKSKKDYGYTKDNKPINYTTDIHSYGNPEKTIPKDIPLSIEQKKLNFTVIVHYKIFGKNGVVTEYADSINVIAKKEIANNSNPNMFMNKPMMTPRF